MLNQHAVDSLFAGTEPLAILPTDPESNLENYAGSKQVSEAPLQLPIFVGARITLTKNLNKAIGFVNGMGATVVALDNGNVIAKTDLGRLLAVHLGRLRSG